MKQKSEVPGQLTLLTVAPTSETKLTVHDPYWDEITAPSHPQPEDRWKEADFGEVPRKSDSDGQLTIFYDDSHEPPDPDDYLNHQEYEQAWRQWEILVRAQVTSITPETTVEPPVRAQAVLDTKKVAPEHNTHWVEKYWVERSGNKYWYYRYCWMVGRKKNRCHLGSVNSKLAKHKKADIEVWISDGYSPLEIQKLIHQAGESHF